MQEVHIQCKVSLSRIDFTVTTNKINLLLYSERNFHEEIL